MLKLVLEHSKVFLELDDAVSNDLTCLAQLVLVLDVLWSELSDTDHLGELGIAAGADEARHLFSLGFCLELETLQLCQLAFVGSGFVLNLLSEWLERLCKRQHLWQVTKRPLGRISEVFHGLRTSCRLAQIGEEGSTLVYVRTQNLEFLREN